MADRRASHAYPRRRPALRRSLALAGLVSVLLGVMLPAFGDTPETGPDPNVALTVTPDDMVSNGATVTVTGSGFPPNTPGVIRQCGGSAGAPQCDLDVAATFVTTASGDIPPTPVTVTRIVDTGATTFNRCVQACWLVATAGGRTSQHHVSVAAAGTVVPTSTPPTSTPPTTFPGLPHLGSLCGVLRAIIEPLPFLRSLLEPVLSVLGCAPSG